MSGYHAGEPGEHVDRVDIEILTGFLIGDCEKSNDVAIAETDRRDGKKSRVQLRNALELFVQFRNLRRVVKDEWLLPIDYDIEDTLRTRQVPHCNAE